MTFLLPADTDVKGALIQQDPTVSLKKQHSLSKQLSDEDTEARLTLALHYKDFANLCSQVSQRVGWRRRAEVEGGVAHGTLCFGVQTGHNNETNTEKIPFSARLKR